MKLFFAMAAVAFAAQAFGAEEIRGNVVGPYETCFNEFTQDVYAQITGVKKAPVKCEIVPSGQSSQMLCTFDDGSRSRTDFSDPRSTSYQYGTFGIFGFKFKVPGGKPGQEGRFIQLYKPTFPFLVGILKSTELTGKLGEVVGHQRELTEAKLILPTWLEPRAKLTNYETKIEAPGVTLDIAKFVDCLRWRIAQKP